MWRKRANACVRHAFDRGINLFDTSNTYGHGGAEEVLGRALRDFPRSSYVLATKVCRPMGEGPNDRGLSRKHIMEQAHASMRRLGVDYIDLYQCHRYDVDTPLDETLRALDDLIGDGKILYAGVSEWSAVQIDDAVHHAKRLNLHPIASNQPRYNLLERYIEREVLPLCEREGIGQIVFSPLAQGVLTGKYQPGQPAPEGSRGAIAGVASQFLEPFLQEPVLRAVDRLRPIAAELHITLGQLALAWVLRQPGVSSAITGASRPEQIDENVQAAEVALNTAVLQAIDEIIVPVAFS